ncbi:MAG: hypothetical protein LQ343_004939 [Gyalolechia ehrenbergii]|nr:MAG: hypothetical protein LQ343_004939 [Gyalolechia ehrenbergii]
MSAASTAPPTLMRSSSRRQQSYSAPTNERLHRSSSNATRPPAAPNTIPRTAQQPLTSDRPPSSAQQAQLATVASRDYETTNVARPPSSRRSSSRERSYAAPPPKRTESTRDTRRQSGNPAHSRTSSHVSPAVPVANGPSSTTPSKAPAADPAAQGSGGAARRRTTIPAQTGQWSLGKTIGAGSMGKVKLAKNLETGEQVAVKIVPRQSTDEHHNNRERERADQSKEVRTAREAAIVTLLNHPYICAMRDVVRTNYHWYMLFEYVNGGQMLDYIISHGRLKEKQARKFGRQIASALDYCHRNSIVHRDLKIENILISKTGDIKIIDFGLSNLFSPRAHLKTFCGSLYFAAPELLNAKQYTGPEVDIWSFGIVLYVLVCGKVPFDDQSMPQLHAKIKEGVVDYPSWLSHECRNLISRMLVTDPKKRANLAEILNHPWITKGFNAPPENYLPHREPIQLPLDSAVVEKMTGFDFGSSEYITRELTKVINSDEYQEAVRQNAREQISHAASGEKKRGVFDFYKRRSSVSSKDTLINNSSEAVQFGSDPINAFSPFLSIYYLVKEKQEREKVETNPGALSMPISPGEKPLRMPDLPPPEAAYTNSTTYEMPGEKATGGRSRPRSRTHGEDDVTEGMKRVNLNVPRNGPTPSLVPPAEQPVRKESTAAGLLRRFSTRRSKEPSRDRSTANAPSLQVQPPPDHGTVPRKSFSVRRSRNREMTPQIHPGGSTPHQPDLLAPSTTRETRPAATLDRSASVNSGDHRKRQSRRVVSERHVTLAILEPPLTSGSDRSDASGHKSKASEPAPTEHTPSLNPRNATARTKSLGHARRESMQARRSRREETQESREAGVPEETDQELAEDERARKNGSTENMKPVFLKGLFSVSTTSSKPLSYIRSDIVRVLRQLGVDYTEIKGGFSCRHAPSIDIHANPPNPEQGFTPKTNRRISFGGFRGGDNNRDDDDRSPQMVRNFAAQRQQHGTQDTSFTGSEGSDDESVRRPAAAGGDQHASTATEAGQTTTHVQNDFGSNMVLRFEIFIVKVPLFSLHGIQFKKVAGGTWSYKNMASKILDALRL